MSMGNQEQAAILFICRIDRDPGGYSGARRCAGVDPLDVQRHSGHASLDMLKRYMTEINFCKY